MTRDDVMRLSGRELDEAVAALVFGLRVVECDPVDGRYGPYTAREGYWTRVNGETYPLLDLLPEYSTDIAAAWEVVERLTELMELTVGVRNVAQGWACCVYSGCEEVVDVRGKSAPEAICRAALLAAAERSGSRSNACARRVDVCSNGKERSTRRGKRFTQTRFGGLMSNYTLKRGGDSDVMYLTCATFLEAGLITGDCCGSCLSDLDNDVAIHCVPCPTNPDIEAEVCCHHVEAVKSLSAEAWESALRVPGGGEA